MMKLLLSIVQKTANLSRINGQFQPQGYYLFAFEKVLAYKSLRTNKYVSYNQCVS